MFVVRNRFFASFGALLISSFTLIGCGDRDLNSLPTPSSQSVVLTNDYPAVVKVLAPNGGGMCTGTFVSERAVLTAAHCTLTSGTYTVVTSFGVFTTNNAPLNYGPGVVDDPNDISILYFNTDVADAQSGQVMDLGDTVSGGDTVRLVGYGCNDIQSRSGAGWKRTGTNVVYRVSSYVELVTPLTTGGARGILGSVNRAGSCFGDSGGPLLKDVDGELKIVGIAHAGGYSSQYVFSDYVSMDRSDNRDFVSEMNQIYNLGIGI